MQYPALFLTIGTQKSNSFLIYRRHRKLLGNGIIFKISNSCFLFYFQWVSDGQGLTDDIQTTLEDEENGNDQDDLDSDSAAADVKE